MTEELQPRVFVDGQEFEWPAWSKLGVQELRNEFELGYDAPWWNNPFAYMERDSKTMFVEVTDD